MPAVFFDLETSDRDPIGQILNFSFICVNDRFQPIAEYSGDIRLSRLQLPSPSAILANRIDILEHQRTSERTERDFCREFVGFMEKLIDESAEPVLLIGYNSFRFDIPYLRTVLIRNGVSPYFRGKLQYRDLYAASRKLSISHPNFPRRAALKATKEDKDRLSLSLETLSTALGTLQGRQLHHARADVLLTIKLAEVFLEQFGFDIRKHEAYEGLPLHSKKRSGEVFSLLSPQYELLSREKGIFTAEPVTLLDVDGRGSALWINLAQFKASEGKRWSIQYAKPASSFILAPREVTDDEKKLAQDALKAFSDIRLSNFFTRSVCDVEMDIYRIDFDGIDALHDAIWRQKKDRLKSLNNRDCQAVYTRYVLANFSKDEHKESRFDDLFREYAQHRYGGKLLLSKSLEPRDDGKPPRYHATLKSLQEEIETLQASGSKEDRKLLDALESYYKNSEIFAVLRQK